MSILAAGQDAKRQQFSSLAGANAYRSWIYAAANLNAVAVASTPLRLYVRTRPSGDKLWKTARVSRRTKAYLAGDRAHAPSMYTLRKAAEYGDEYEVVTDQHPILELLSKVNPYQNGYDATVLRVLYTELTGNAYLHPVIDQVTNRPVELWTMPSQYVEVIPGKEKFIDGYLYGATREQRKFFAPDEVIHFKRPNPADLYYGIGKVEAAWGAAQMNAASHEMDLAFFENKARPDYLLSVKADASPEELERLEVQIDEKLRGSRRTGRFLTATADIDLKPLSFPPKDLAGRETIVEEIAAVFGVPVSMLKANDPNLASAQSGYQMWREATILPMLRMDEEVLNQNLIPLFGLEDDAFLAYDSPVIEDRRLELEERRTAVAGGWRTANEARKEEGREAIDDPNAERLLINGQPLGGQQTAAAIGGALPFVDGGEGKLPSPTSEVSSSSSDVLQAPAGQPVANTALNGAQISSLVTLAAQAQTGELPLDSARAIAAAAFPSISQTVINSIFDPIVPASAPATLPKTGKASEVNPVAQTESEQPGAVHVWGVDPEQKDAMSDCVSSKIPDLISRGHPQAQAIAIAYSMCESGKSAEAVIAELGIEKKDALSDCVSAKISKLVGEGYPQDQAIAIAYSMCSEGKSQDEATAEIQSKAISDIDTKPPQIVADNAQRALDVRETMPDSMRGMTPVGIARARDLANRVNLSEDTIRRMVAYFDRHEVDKQGNTWDEQGKGWQAWYGWGGDEGRAWANRKLREFDAQRETKSLRAKLFEFDMADMVDLCVETKDCGTGAGGFQEGNSCGGASGGSSGSSKPSSSRSKPSAAAGKPPADGLSEPKKHDIAIPVNPRRMTVDQFDSALSALGYESVKTRVENPNSRTDRTVYHTVKDRNGNTAEVNQDDLVATIYANSSDPKLAAVKPARRRKKSCGCGCSGEISQKSMWKDYSDPPIRTKATRKDTERKYEAATKDEDAIGAAVDKVLERQIKETIKALNSSDVPTQDLTVKVELMLRSAKWDRQIVEAMRPYLQAALQRGLIVGTETVKKLAVAIPDFNPPQPQLEAYTQSESVRLARGAARGVNKYTAVRVTEIIGTGVLDGLTIPEIASKVQDWAVAEEDGVRATRRRALTIARTESQRATRSAEVEAWKSSGLVEGKTWLLAPDPCEFCEAASKAFSADAVGIEDAFYEKGHTLTGADGGTMVLDYESIQGPPLHPNCRCSLQPKLMDGYEQIAQEAEQEIIAQQQALLAAQGEA